VSAPVNDDLDLCVARTRGGGRVPPELAARLDPVDR